MTTYKRCLALCTLYSLSMYGMNALELTDLYPTDPISMRIKNGRDAHKWYKKLINEATEEYESERLRLSFFQQGLPNDILKNLSDSTRIYVSTLHYAIENLRHEAKKNGMIVILLQQGKNPKYAGLPFLEELLKYKIIIYQGHIKKREAQIKMTSSQSRKQKLKREIYTLLERKAAATEMRVFAATIF